MLIAPILKINQAAVRNIQVPTTENTQAVHALKWCKIS